MTKPKYPETATRCAEILRVALPQMTRQPAGVNPISYAVWFEHCSGRNPRLSQALLSLTQDGKLLDDAATWQLYQQHVAELSEQSAYKVADDIRRVMREMTESAQLAGAQTDRFGDSLTQFSGSVEHGAMPDAAALQDVLTHTQEMRQAVGQLKGRLDASQQEIEKLRTEVDRARSEAMVDSLTGLPNRRAFDAAMSAALATGTGPMCLLVADIDHFKKINDTYGHLFGDTVLKVVAQAMKSVVAAPQVAARVGGEEFAVLVPAAAADAALQLAERIRTTIAGSRIRRKDSQESIGQITLSLGVALHQPREAADAWFDRADRALYISKASGRNRVTLADNAATVSAAHAPAKKANP